MRNPGYIVFIAFLAGLLALGGQVVSLWFLLQGLLRLMPKLMDGSITISILTDLNLSRETLSGVFWIWLAVTELFSLVSGGYLLFLLGMFLPLFGLISVLVLLLLRNYYNAVRGLLAVQFFLYAGSLLLCYPAVNKLTRAIGVLESPYSYAPLIILGSSILACSMLGLAAFLIRNKERLQ